ncbi:MAG: TolC family protein [Azospira sp.]|jgi:cobalt-zinc-cadmium efflux system outer membrane protein|nr:TolC family protein [Azospira sp.]
MRKLALISSLATLAALGTFAAPLHAQTLREAVDAAWARQPAARALAARQNEFTARHEAADGILSGPPAATLANRNDRLQRNDGLTEWEAGIALPLWLPGYQKRTLALIERERDAFAALADEARWRLAGEVRERWWQHRLTENERMLAERRVAASRRLLADVETRVRAGDLPRIDLNQARSAEAAAKAVLAVAEARQQRSTRSFLTLTGLPSLPAAEGMNEKPQEADPAATHPALAPLERAVDAARARLHIASGNVRDLPELAFAMRRERPLDGASWEGSAGIEIRIPLATDARNRPRVAAANAELIEAEARIPYVREQIAAESEAARHELARAIEAAERAELRHRLSTETEREYARAFALGNIDLPQRLRVEADAFDAELAAARARIEAARAVSRYNQAIGVLP